MTWKPILFCSSDMPADKSWGSVSQHHLIRRKNPSVTSITAEPSISSEEYFHHKHCDDEKVGITCHPVAVTVETLTEKVRNQ